MMPTVRSLVTRVLSPLIRAVEGQPRSGPYRLPITGGWLPDGVATNWWQQGYSPVSGDRSGGLIMPMIVNDRRKRLAFPFFRQSATRSNGETLEQLQEQLRREQSQRAFDHKYYQEQISLLLRGNAELRLEISRRDREGRICRPAAPARDDALMPLGFDDDKSQRLSSPRCVILAEQFPHPLQCRSAIDVGRKVVLLLCSLDGR
jgi:hypothetical protein